MDIRSLIAATKELTSEEDVDDYKKKYNTFFNDEVLQQIGSHDTSVLVGFICASIETGFGLPVSWATKLLDKRKMFDFKIRIDLGHKILNCLMLMDETCKVKRPRYMFDLYFKFVKAVKTHKVLKEYETKMIEIITEGLSRDVSVLHLYLHVPCEDIPWTKYTDKSIEVLTLVLQRIQTERISSSADISSAIWRTLMDLFQDHCESNNPGAIASAVSPIFHYCKEQETENPSDRFNANITWRLLEIIMQDYLNKCKNKPEVCEPMIGDVGDLCKCGDKKLEKIANSILKATAGLYPTKKESIKENRVTEKEEKAPETNHVNTELTEDVPTDQSLEIVEETKNDLVQNEEQQLQNVSDTALRKDEKIEPVLESNVTKEEVETTEMSEMDEGKSETEKVDENMCTTQKEEFEENTPNHAPEWSPKFCRVLNSENNNAWTIMAQHLGYTTSDTTKWSSQPNPCMALLDDYFNARTTKDATVGLLAAVKTMEHSEAISIVTDALQIVDEILDNQPKKFKKPPAILITYHYDVHDKVMILQRHLLEAGFKSWISIGQMGGNDELYDSIDQGLKASTVVICCVSAKYTLSSNNISEVNQTAILGKPVIPLLMEKMSWPPPGSMGPIFGEHLFIRFFTRSGEETGDQRFWSAAKFQELLVQLRYFIAPKERLVSADYIGWWKPEQSATKAKDTKERQTAITKKKAEEPNKATSTSIFISYQWEKHTEVKALYRRLTSLGYHCWLDVYHMEGKQPLYDSIDKAVRECKVMLSCVTSKYALAAKCRHELMLADVIQKPIIPIVLEKMDCPPDGQISMALGDLRHYEFTNNPDAQLMWSGDKFDELLVQMKEFIPEPDFEIENQATQKQEDSVDLQLVNELADTAEDNDKMTVTCDNDDVKPEQQTEATPDHHNQHNETGDGVFNDQEGDSRTIDSCENSVNNEKNGNISEGLVDHNPDSDIQYVDNSKQMHDNTPINSVVTEKELDNNAENGNYLVGKSRQIRSQMPDHIPETKNTTEVDLYKVMIDEIEEQNEEQEPDTQPTTSEIEPSSVASNLAHEEGPANHSDSEETTDKNARKEDRKSLAESNDNTKNSPPATKKGKGNKKSSACVIS